MEDSGKKTRGRGRGAARGRGRGKGRGRGRGRGAKVAAVVESDDEQMLLDDGDADATKSLDDTASPLLDKSPAASAATATDASKPASPAASAVNGGDAAEIAADDANATPTDNETATAGPAIDAAVAVALLPPAIDMESDISQLEAPTFTTLSRGPPEPMTRLKWDHKVNLIGEKVLNPMIHCCNQCDNVKPILIYGRMIPCKHVFCLKCGRDEPCPKACPRCKEKVVRVEQSGLGTVFMCTHGGSRYGTTGCRRTYLSQRDLQAHINHRHVSLAALPAGAEYKY